MNQKHHVSQTIAKQLVEAGIVIESEYVWQKWNNAEDWVIRRPIQRGKTVPEIFQEIPAPIATEILEWFPRGYDFGFELIKLGEGYGAICKDYRVMPYERIGFTKDDNAPDALALLLIRLTKDGLI